MDGHSAASSYLELTNTKRISGFGEVTFTNNRKWTLGMPE